MKAITLVIGLGLACVQSAWGAIGSWSSNGPEGVQGLDIAVSAAAPDVLLIASAGGLFKSINSGTSWVRVAPSLSYVTQVWASPTNPNLFLALTSSRLYRSTNGGTSWSVFGTGLPAAATASLARLSVDASNPNRMMIVDYTAGIFRSTDGGATFAAAAPLPGTPATSIENYIGVAIDPVVPSRVFVSVCTRDATATIYRSTDSGVTFTGVASTISGGSACAEARFAFNTLTPGTVLNAAGLRSTDGGVTFASLPAFSLSPVYFDYRNGSNELYVGTYVGLSRSTDNGDTFSNFGTGLVDNGSDTSAIQAVAFKPGASPVVTYALSAAGSFFKTPAGSSVFAQSNTGLNASNIRAIAVHPTNANVLMAGWGDVGLYAAPSMFRSTDRGLTWARANAGLNLDEVRTVVMDPNTTASVASTVMYAGGWDRAPFGRAPNSYSGSIAKSTDGGLTWTHPSSFTPALPALNRMGKARSIVLDRTSGSGAGGTGPLQKIYFTGSGRVICPSAGAGVVAQTLDSPRIWRSVDAGAAFSSIDSLPTGTCVAGSTVGPSNFPIPNPLAIDPSSPNTIYVGTYLGLGYNPSFVPAPPVPTVQNGVFKSIDGGASWTHASNGLPRVVSGDPTSSHRDVLALAINPSNPQVLYAAANPTSGVGQGRVYKTINGGANWTLASTGISGQDVRALVVDPTDPNKVYAATGGNNSGPGGVYVSADAGVSWNSTSVNLPSSSATALALDRSGANPILYAGTNNGVYDITQVPDLDADGPPDVTEASAAFGGDGNEDGIPDSQQTNVASIAGEGAARSALSPLNATVTVSISPLVGTCTRMNDAGSIEAEKVGPLDDEYTFPTELVRFELLDCTSAFVSIRYVGQSFGPRFKFRSFGPEIIGNPGSVAWRSVSAGVTGNTWTFQLNDNTPGDNRDEAQRILFFGGPGFEGLFSNGFE
jgi:hypothetical protein